MRLTIKEPEINIGVDGFVGQCQLGRAETGKKLSELVEKIEDPVVIALDGSWGSGKSFFLKCWTGAHTKENGGKAKVIYFDAFQHDFLDDPLIALTGVLADQFDPKSKAGKAIGLAKKAVSKMWRPAARIGLAAATAGTSEMAGAVGDAAIATSSNELNKASENFWKKEDGRRAAMGEFRTALEKLTEQDKGGTLQKIVIIIDELDRCRPDYALTMLEVIKHFFAVDNVHFVLGINIQELQNSVRARYGAGVDAAKYLQKFVHIKFPIRSPKSTRGNMADYSRYYDLVSCEMGLDSHWKSNWIRDYLLMINYHHDISLRDIQRIVSLAVVTPDIGLRSDAHYHIFTGLLLLQVIKPDWIVRARVGQLPYSDVESFFKFGRNASDGEHFQVAEWAWKLSLDPKQPEPNGVNIRSLLDDSFLDTRRYTIVPDIIATCLDAFQLIHN